MVPDLAAAAAHAPLRSAISPMSGAESSRPPRSFAFGPFLLQPERQSLLRDGQSVRIGGRSFDILTILAGRAGELVSKRELIELVWPAIFVDDGNLKANVAALRRALGETHAAPLYIATIVGRGYRFVAPVRVIGTG